MILSAIISISMSISMALAAPVETDPLVDSLTDFRGDRKPAVLEEFSSIEAEPVDLELDFSKDAPPPQTEVTSVLDVE